MRTRAQASRDAALRRMTNVNRSLALAALLGAGVVTDVAAHSASGHPLKVGATAGGPAGYQTALLVSGGATGRGATHHGAPASHSATHGARTRTGARSRQVSPRLQSSPAPSAPAASSQSSASPPAAAASQPAPAPAQPVVVVSGGS